VGCCRWNVGLEAQWNLIYGQTIASSHWLIWRSLSTWVTSKPRQDVRFKWQITGPIPLRPGIDYIFFCRFFCRILPLKCWPRSLNKLYIRANDSQFTSTDLAVFVHLSHFEETARRPIQVTNYRSRVPLGQEANSFCFALSLVEYCRWNVALEAQWNFIYGRTTASSHRLIWRSSSTWVTSKPRQDVRFEWQITGAGPLRPGSEYFFFCRFFCRILPLKCRPRSSVKLYIRADDSQLTSTDLAVFVHLSHLKTTARLPILVTNYRGRVPLLQEANIFRFAVSFVEYCRWNAGLEAQWDFIYLQTTTSSHRLIWHSSSTWVTSKPRQDVWFRWQITGADSF